MGDAAGVGPEVSAKALAEKEVYDFCNPIVIGDADVITKSSIFTGMVIFLSQ